MPTYEKLTFERFKQHLKDGDKYKNLTGARRAIGKATSWSTKDREAAAELAEKHFGTDSTPKAAPKTGAKRGPKKGAKAAAAAVAKKPGRKPRAEAETTSEVASQVTASAPQTADDKRSLANEMLAFAANARQQVEALTTAAPSTDVQAQYGEIATIVKNAISYMKQATGGTPTPARVEIPKAPPPVEIKQTVAQTEDNGVVSDDQLTPAEKQAKQLFQQSNPNLGLGLPPPTQS